MAQGAGRYEALNERLEALLRSPLQVTNWPEWDRHRRELLAEFDQLSPEERDAGSKRRLQRFIDDAQARWDALAPEEQAAEQAKWDEWERRLELGEETHEPSSERLHPVYCESCSEVMANISYRVSHLVGFLDVGHAEKCDKWWPEVTSGARSRQPHSVYCGFCDEVMANVRYKTSRLEGLLDADHVQKCGEGFRFTD